MSLVAVGEMSVGAAVPAGVELAAIADATAGAQLTALAGFNVSVDLGGLSADLLLAGQIAAGIQAAITAGLTPPSVQAQLDIVAALKAELEALLAIVANLVGLFATAGVKVYAWDGTASALGAALTSELAGDGNHSNALILLTEIGATWTAMGSVFKVTP